MARKYRLNPDLAFVSYQKIAEARHIYELRDTLNEFERAHHQGIIAGDAPHVIFDPKNTDSAYRLFQPDLPCFDGLTIRIAKDEDAYSVSATCKLIFREAGVDMVFDVVPREGLEDHEDNQEVETGDWIEPLKDVGLNEESHKSLQEFLKSAKEREREREQEIARLKANIERAIETERREGRLHLQVSRDQESGQTKFVYKEDSLDEEATTLQKR